MGSVDFLSDLPSVASVDDPLGHRKFRVLADGRDLTCSRIAGGVAWPEVGQPGFLVVLGLDMYDDPDVGGTPVHVLLELMEFGGETFLSVEPILEAIRVVRGKVRCGEWFGLECPRPRALSDFNRNETAYRRQPVRIKEVDEPDFGRMLEMVFRRTVVRKLLHFGQSALPGYLSALPAEAARTGKFTDHPPVTALLFALAGLEGTRGEPVEMRRKSRVVDRVAGY